MDFFLEDFANTLTSWVDLFLQPQSTSWAWAGVRSVAERRESVCTEVRYKGLRICSSSPVGKLPALDRGATLDVQQFSRHFPTPPPQPHLPLPSTNSGKDSIWNIQNHQKPLSPCCPLSMYLSTHLHLNSWRINQWVNHHSLSLSSHDVVSLTYILTCSFRPHISASSHCPTSLSLTVSTECVCCTYSLLFTQYNPWWMLLSLLLTFLRVTQWSIV